MTSLSRLVSGYLRAAGFEIRDETPRHVVASRAAEGFATDSRIVWTVPDDTQPRAYESRLSPEITRLTEKYPEARATVLHAGYGGFSRDFRKRLADSRIQVLVPVQYFDTPFKVDKSPETQSVIADMLAQSAVDRVPQPYRQRGSTESTGQDLLECLLEETQVATQPRVTLVTGRAGMGKTFLARALFAELYARFAEGKRAQRTVPRPIPLRPEHLPRRGNLHTEHLLDRFIQTDIAAPITRSTFRWLLCNGFATWLLDGLDELLLADPRFFDFVLDVITEPGSRANVVIFVRDSLLTTSDAFLDFREMTSDDVAVQEYDLISWPDESKRLYVSSALGHDEARTADFLETVQTHALRRLSGIPFYCQHLVTQYMEGSIWNVDSETEILQKLVTEMINREVRKGLLDPEDFEENGLGEWLEEIAVGYIDNSFSAVDENDAMAFGQVVLRESLTEAAQMKALAGLLQFPLFTKGERSHTVKFSHDLLAQSLGARHYARLVVRNPRHVGDKLRWIDPSDVTQLRIVASHITVQESLDVVQTLRSMSSHDESFRIILASLCSVSRR